MLFGDGQLKSPHEMTASMLTHTSSSTEAPDGHAVSIGELFDLPRPEEPETRWDTITQNQAQFH